ncbi:hypothetical protein PXH81_07830 [Xylella fastidiosa]|uniref:hypothetical protein n=2 Tax=Xylella fastidiosa TaxID=2371 RepID=UPI0013E3FDF0|nr:hypothetical protein [Xylella fastidiosa]WDV82333.1 hypothetical protein PXH81_07830 [Xylella fastidiosa]
MHMGQGSASQIIPRHPTTQLPNYPITQLPNYPITQLPNYPITQLPNYPTTQLPNYPTTQLPNYPTTQLPNYPTTQLPKRQTTTQLKQCYGRAGQGRAGPTISRTSAAACIVCRDRIYIPPLQHLIMPGRFAEDHP